MSTLILSSNKYNIVTYRNSTNNGDSDKNGGSNNGSNRNDITKEYAAKIIHIQDEPSTLVNHGSIILYTFGLRLGN